MAICALFCSNVKRYFLIIIIIVIVIIIVIIIIIKLIEEDPVLKWLTAGVTFLIPKKKY
jgi:hypothetical protein